MRVESSKSKFRLTPPEPSEDEFQHSVAQLLDHVFRGRKVVWSHFPSGGYFLSKAAAARLYRLGLKRGMPDIMIWWRDPFDMPRCIGIELKTSKGRPSTPQRKKHAELEEAGVACAVCRTLDEVVIFLRHHQVPMLKVRLNAETLYGNQGTEGRGAAQPAQSAGQAARA
jgi:hypothetical protein